MKLLLISLMTIAFAAGKEIPPPPYNFVLDETNTLSSQEKQALKNQLQDFQSSTGHQMVVALFSSLKDENFEDYINRVFRQWKIGDAKKNDGVLLVVVPADRRYWTEVGYGLEGILTDAYVFNAAKKILAPQLKNQKYFEGINLLIENYKSVLLSGKVPEEPQKEKEGSPWLIFLTLGVMGIFLKAFSNFARRMDIKSPKSRRRNDFWGGDGGWGGGGWGGGSGFGGGGDGGGFSGGGGSSGGGGAGGSW